MTSSAKRLKHAKRITTVVLFIVFGPPLVCVAHDLASGKERSHEWVPLVYEFTGIAYHLSVIVAILLAVAHRLSQSKREMYLDMDVPKSLTKLEEMIDSLDHFFPGHGGSGHHATPTERDASHPIP